MAAVGQLVIGRLDCDFVEGVDIVVNRHMEGIGVIRPIGHTGNHTVFFLVYPNETAGQPFGGGGDQGEIQMVLRTRLIHPLAHVADDFETEVLCLPAFAMMDAEQGLEAFGQADESEGKGAVLEHLPHLVVGGKLVRVDPHALSHQEGVIAYPLFALDLEPFEQLGDNQVDLAVEFLEEEIHVAVAADRNAGQIDGGKGDRRNWP